MENSAPEEIFQEEFEREAQVYTFDEGLDKIGFGIYQVILMFICGSGWMFDGIEILLISFILPELTALWELSPVQAGLCGSSVYFGMMIGAALGGIISDILGRKIIFIGAVTITTVFGFASAFSPGYVYFLIFRTCAGIGLGASVPTDISLFTEFCPTKYRGITLVLMNVYFGFGAAYVCVAAWIIMPSQIIGSHHWRILVGVAALPGVLIIIARLFVPESPRYQMVKGKVHKASATLHSIATFNQTKLPKGKLVYHVTGARPALIQSIFGLFSKELWLTTVLLWVMWFCLSYGAWGFSFLIPVVLDQLHQGRSKSYIYSDTLVILFVGALGVAALAAVVDKFGRRILMTVFFIACGILTLITGLFKNGAYILIVASLVGITSTPPWGIIYTYTPEVYPTTLRTTGVGLCAFFTRLAGTITPLIGTTLLHYGFIYPFITFGFALLVAGACSALLPIETLGRELQDEVTADTLLSADALNKKKDGSFKQSQKESMAPLIDK
eukprot:gene8474-296_t